MNKFNHLSIYLHLNYIFFFTLKNTTATMSVNGVLKQH